MELQQLSIGQMAKLKISQDAILRSINNFNRYMTLPQIGKIFYEYYLRMFKDFLMEQNFPISYFSNVGTMMRHDSITQPNRTFFSDEIFLFVDQNAHLDLKTEKVPAGTYMSMCCREFDMEKTYAKQLFEELDRNHYEPLGDYLCEVVAEYPNSENGQREIFYKMQVRIK